MPRCERLGAIGSGTLPALGDRCPLLEGANILPVWAAGFRASMNTCTYTPGYMHTSIKSMYMSLCKCIYDTQLSDDPHKLYVDGYL